MKSKFVIFVIIGTLLVAAIYSASTYFVFAAPVSLPDMMCVAGETDPAVQYCVDTKNKIIKACEWKGGKRVCVQLTSTGGTDIPPDLRDAFSKAQGVKPDVSLGEGGNTTKVPKSDLLNDGGLLKGQSDNQTTSQRIIGPNDRFCLEGTGGDTGSPCLPCDPGLKFAVGCIDVTTGGPLDMPDAATSESGESDDTNPKDLDGSNNDDNSPQLNPGE